MPCIILISSGSVEVWESIHGKPPGREGFTVFPVLLHPRSRGSVRLQSSDADEAVLLNPNYLAESADVKILIEGEFYQVVSFVIYGAVFCIRKISSQIHSVHSYKPSA